MRSLKQLMVSRFWNRTHAGDAPATWLHEPTVRRRVNRRITGSEDVWPVDWFAREMASGGFPRAVSLGCGEGALERDLVSKGVCRTMLGLDISNQALELARRHAGDAGLSGLEYRQADLDRLELQPEDFEAAFAHQALHHVRDLEGCLAQVAGALTPGGVLYVDEYGGPSRHEWSRALLAGAQAVYSELPRAVRRRRQLRLPVDWRDPSEAVRSSEIVPLIAETFDVQARRDYGGNLLSVIYPHLRLAGLEAAAREDLLAHLLTREDEMLAAGVPSFYMIVIAARRALP